MSFYVEKRDRISSLNHVKVLVISRQENVYNAFLHILKYFLHPIRFASFYYISHNIVQKSSLEIMLNYKFKLITYL